MFFYKHNKWGIILIIYSIYIINFIIVNVIYQNEIIFVNLINYYYRASGPASCVFYLGQWYFISKSEIVLWLFFYNAKWGIILIIYSIYIINFIIVNVIYQNEIIFVNLINYYYRASGPASCVFYLGQWYFISKSK